MYGKIRRFTEEQHMLKENGRVIAGVSGGADSVCLLFMLCRLRDELSLRLTAVHVNHGIRGDAADADEAYVRRICGEWGVELSVFRRDVPSYAKEHGLSVEEAGREIRRECFLRELHVRGADCVALAHHRDDNAETVLFNLCRGAGIQGLRGILPKNGVWIHPLLCVSRREIESYLGKKGISYCTDETNLEDSYTRNRIRNRILPDLTRYVNRQSAAHIAASAEKLREIWEYIGGEIQRYVKNCTAGAESGETDGELLLKKEEFEKVPEALKPYVIHAVLCSAAGQSRDIGETHIRAVEELFDRQAGRSLELPYGVRARRCYEGIRFAGEADESGRMPLPGESAHEEPPEGLFRFRIFENGPETGSFPKNTYTKWFDYDIIKSTVKIRHRMAGDYIAINKSGGTQKLKQYFVNEKIPREERDSIWLVADGQEIMWIVGCRQSQAYQVTGRTKRILEIVFYGGEKDGGDNKSIDTGGRGCEEDPGDRRED